MQSESFHPAAMQQRSVSCFLSVYIQQLVPVTAAAKQTRVSGTFLFRVSPVWVEVLSLACTFSNIRGNYTFMKHEIQLQWKTADFTSINRECVWGAMCKCWVSCLFGYLNNSFRLSSGVSVVGQVQRTDNPACYWVKRMKEIRLKVFFLDSVCSHVGLTRPCNQGTTC